MLERTQGEIDMRRLIGYALRYGSVSVAKRLGWSLEATGTSAEALGPLLDLEARSYGSLDPGRARRGRYDRRWMIIDNRAEDRV